MNHVLTLLHTAQETAEPLSRPYSDHMQVELLALHDDMIGQLRLERVEIADTGDFLTGMIAQHEKAAALLRIQLEKRDVRMPREISPIVPGTFPPLPFRVHAPAGPAGPLPFEL